ncbi:SpaA isopeptide-forming pilin-related protein [Streptococcus suis]
MQVQNEDGSWRIAEVENAVQNIEAPDEATSTQLVWENVANSSATYRIIERAATNSELVNKTGNGSKEDPFVLTREVTEATVSMDSFLRSASNVQIAEQSGSFTLKKVNEKGKALAGAVFTLSDSTGTVMQTITTTNDSKGTVFSNLTKGTYTLRETKAPKGYQLLNDYYEIRVNHYGIVEAKYIKSTNLTSEEKISESRGNTIIRQPKVENVVEVLKYELTSTRSDTKKDNEDAVWMTSGEFIKLAFELKVKPDTQPGDSFTIKLDSKLSPTGIRERTLPPIPLKVGDTVVATGRYDEATNSFIYTFNDYVRREQNIKLSASYATMGADLKNVPYSGKQSFTNVIDGQVQPLKTFYIDYGASREMPGGVAKGLKIRNQVASVNRLTGEVERIIYINNGNDLSRDYVSSSLWSRHQITLDNQGQTDITNLEIFKVPNALKHTYMPDSMYGGTDGLEKITSAQYNPKSSAIIIEKNEFYDDATGKYSNGFLIKITEKLRVPTAATNMTATWGFTGWSSNSVSVSASVVASQAESAGEAERKTPVITISNKKEVVPTKTSITVRKQWLNEDGSKIGEPTISSITYNLNQISTTEDGTKTTTVYQANQTLTAAEQWTKRYDNLPISGVNEAKQKVSYAYYVEEVSLPGYSVRYLNESNADTVNPAEAAIVKGILTIKNQKLNMTSITVNKQWFTADKQPTDHVNGEISYDLKQIVHFDDGRKIIKDYLSGETLNHTMNWSRTYHELPKKGKEEGETVTYSYFVQEHPITGYNTSYQSENNEVDVATPENVAIVSGIITIRNVSTRKYVLPNTGGPGVIMYYLLGVIVLLVVAGGLFYKFNLYS